jgi:hypothetical protein
MIKEHRHFIPIWFFIGCLLLIYGILILGAGIFQPAQTSAVALGYLHANIWWGALLIVLGTVYCIKFRPK